MKKFVIFGLSFALAVWLAYGLRCNGFLREVLFGDEDSLYRTVALIKEIAGEQDSCAEAVAAFYSVMHNA